MKIISLTSYFILSAFIGFSQLSEANGFFKRTDLFMAMNVENGKVNYAQIAENSAQLNDLVREISSLSIKEIAEEEVQKAFLINAYNILVIKGLIDNYPTNSPTAITGFFDRTKYKVADFGEVTLNDLENKLIREVYNDARVHFVLVCGAVSCPPIINKAYFPATLDAQLTTQTTLALNNPSFIRITENEVAISEIFKWYSEDFVTKDQTVLDYINQYQNTKISSDKKLKYYTYDWTINSTSSILVSAETSVIMEFTPSKLMKKGQWDIKNFNNLYTENSASNGERQVSDIPRQTFFTSILEVYTGISKKGRVNVGGVINFRSNAGNNAPLTDVFRFNTQPGLSRTGISNVGIAMKISPFKKKNNISIQSTFFFPVFEDRASSYYLDRRSYIWENKFFYDKSFFADKFQIFAQLDVSYHFGSLQRDATPTQNSGERFANNSLALPVAVFLSYFPTNKFTVYMNAQQYQLVPLIQNGFGQEFTVIGLGTKYQLTKRLNIEASTSSFVRGTSTGLGNTYNLGFRFVY